MKIIDKEQVGKSPKNGDFLNDRKKIIVTIIITVLIGFAVNILISLLSDFNKVIDTLSRVKVQQVLVPFLIYFSIYLIDSFRLMFMSRIFDFRIKLKDAFYNSVMGVFISHLTPSASGGHPFQIFHLKSLGYNSKVATNIIVSRYLVFMFSGTLMVLLFMNEIIDIIGKQLMGTKFLIIGLVVSFGLTILLSVSFFFPRIMVMMVHFLDVLLKNKGKALDRIHLFEEWTSDFRDSMLFLWKNNFWAVLIDAALCNMVLFFQAYSLYYVLDIFTPVQIGPFRFLLIFVLSNLVAYYLPTPGGSGGIEGVYSLIMSGLLAQPNVVAAALFIWRISTYYLHLVFGFIVLIVYGRKKKIKVIAIDE